MTDLSGVDSISILQGSYRVWKTGNGQGFIAIVNIIINVWNLVILLIRIDRSCH